MRDMSEEERGGLREKMQGMRKELQGKAMGVLNADLGGVSAVALIPAFAGMAVGQAVRRRISETAFRRAFNTGGPSCTSVARNRGVSASGGES